MDTHISIILKISDRFGKRPLLAQEAVVSLNDQRVRPLYKTGGYFIFNDLEPGPAVFRIVSPIFQTELLEVEIPPPEKYLMCHIMMNPSKAYPFGGSVTTVSGRLVSQGRPLGGKLFHVIPGNGGEVMKIAEDKAEAGNCFLKLFVSVPERQLPVPGKYLIKDKDEGKREFCFITQRTEKEGVYSLEKGLSYNHARATPLVSVIDCLTSPDGRFFIALPEMKGDRVSVDFLFTDANGKPGKKSVEIITKKENKLADIEI